jgi:hypothetical protein
LIEILKVESQKYVNYLEEVSLGQRDPRARKCAWEGSDAESMTDENGEFVRNCFPPAYNEFRESHIPVEKALKGYKKANVGSAATKAAAKSSKAKATIESSARILRKRD